MAKAEERCKQAEIIGTYKPSIRRYSFLAHVYMKGLLPNTLAAFSTASIPIPSMISVLF